MTSYLIQAAHCSMDLPVALHMTHGVARFGSWDILCGHTVSSQKEESGHDVDVWTDSCF